MKMVEVTGKHVRVITKDNIPSYAEMKSSEWDTVFVQESGILSKEQLGFLANRLRGKRPTLITCVGSPELSWFYQAMTEAEDGV